MHATVNHKENFTLALQPFLEMLAYQQEHVSHLDWMKLVHTLLSRVVENPEQYLGHELPSEKIIQQLANEIFDEFTQSLKPAEREAAS